MCQKCRRPGFDPWVGKFLWRREWPPTPVFWPGEFHGLYSPWGRKELDTTEQLSRPEAAVVLYWLYRFLCLIAFVTNATHFFGELRSRTQYFFKRAEVTCSHSYRNHTFDSLLVPNSPESCTTQLYRSVSLSWTCYWSSLPRTVVLQIKSKHFLMLFTSV